VANRLAQAVVGVPLVETDVVANEIGGAVTGEAVLDIVVVGAVGHGVRSLVALLLLGVPRGVDELVEVAFFQAVGFEKAYVVGFLGEPESPEVAAPGIGRFGGAVHDAKVEVVRKRSGHAQLVEEPEVHVLVQREGERPAVVEALGDRESPPLRGIWLALHVTGLEIMSAIEAKAHAAFGVAAEVPAVAPAQAVADVVVDDAVVDQRPIPVVDEPRRVGRSAEELGDLVGGIVAQRLMHVLGARQQVVDRQPLERLGGEPFVVRDAVVDVKGEVLRRVVRIGGRDLGAEGVGGGDAVAYERSVGLRGYDGGVDVVCGAGVATGAVVEHGNRSPVRQAGVLRIHGMFRVGVGLQRADGHGQVRRNVRARNDHLVFQGHVGDTVLIRRFDGDRDGFARARLLRRVTDPVQTRRQVVGVHGSVGRRRRRGIGTPASRQGVVGLRIDELQGWSARGSRSCSPPRRPPGRRCRVKRSSPPRCSDVPHMGPGQAPG